MLEVHQCKVRNIRQKMEKDKYKTFWKCGKRNEKTKTKFNGVLWAKITEAVGKVNERELDYC